MAVNASATRAIILDVEGTTTPIEFVYGTLFPFARTHLRPYLESQGRHDEYPAFLELMDQDSKAAPLKELQGRIWEDGYRRGELRGVVFEDVAPALRRWQAQQIDVGIFSSGSVLAQQLLFRHSTAGDLTGLIRWHFDTGVGVKTDPDSYRRIASLTGLPPSAILFISDLVRELDAARAAGFSSLLAVRPGNPGPPSDHEYPTINGFDEVAV